MKKTILACIAILLLTVVFLGFAQALLMPKYMSASREGALIAEYYEELTTVFPPHPTSFYSVTLLHCADGHGAPRVLVENFAQRNQTAKESHSRFLNFKTQY